MGCGKGRDWGGGQETWFLSGPEGVTLIILVSGCLSVSVPLSLPPSFIPSPHSLPLLPHSLLKALRGSYVVLGVQPGPAHAWQMPPPLYYMLDVIHSTMLG